MTTDSDHICFEQIEFAAVTEKGLSDVSILTMGETDGHGMIVDEKTIADFMKLSIGKTLPAYLTHDGAQDAATGKPKDRLGRELGFFSGFHRDGTKVRANFQFLEAFKSQEPKTYATLMELAKNYAQNLGISPVLRHFKAWVLNDGTEVRAEGDNVPSAALNALPSMRLRELLSCDFVRKPAANLGLFEAKIDDKTNTIMSADTILLSKHTEEITSLSAQHQGAIALLETKHKEAVAVLEKKTNDAVAALAVLQEKEKTFTAALAAKQTELEDAQKYDMRKAGGEALQIALETRQNKIPAPAATDAERWNQYALLCEAKKNDRGDVIAHLETPAAKSFKDKFLLKKSA